MKKTDAFFPRYLTLFLFLAMIGAGFSNGVTPAAAALAPESFAELAKQVSPAVVNINTEKAFKKPQGPARTRKLPGMPGPGPSPFGQEDPFQDFFDKFFGDMPKQPKQRSLGSGFIFDREGFIITNNHVVEGADKIKVKLVDGREFNATIKGRDPMTDLALIKIDESTHNLPTLTLGDSDTMQVGDWVLASGNPFGLANTVTQGIISAKGRVIGAGPYDDFLQTDASINPGNSGGPLLNLKGEVIGINTAILATGQGIGFAIPSNIAKSVISQLKEKGKVIRGLIGVQIQLVTPDLAKSFGLKEPHGALVGDVNPGTPAAKAGIQRGDIIIEFNGKPIKEMNELPRMVAQTAPGTEATVKVLRQGKEKTFTVTIGELKAEQQKQLGMEGEGEGEGEKSSLGMTVQELDQALAQRLRMKETSGVVVVKVEQGTPAAESGIRPGDLIEEINANPVHNMKEFNEAVNQLPKGSTSRMLIKRQGRTLYVVVEVP
jgi:serine protease Do